MPDITSFLFQNSPTPPQPVGSDASQSFPLWAQQYVANIANAATNLASQPYSPYPGQQVAQPSDATGASWGMAQQNVGNYQPALQGAMGLTASAAQPITGADISRYMSPFQDQVIGGLTSASNKNLFDNVLPQISDRFVSAGQARSPQEGARTNDALYQSQQALNQSIAGSLSQGYQGALNTALQQQQMQQTAGAQMGQLGALTQQLGAGDVGQLAASGQAQDQTNQANINAAMNNFYAQQQWPYQNLGFASNIIRGLPINTNTQTVGLSYPPQGSYGASPLSTAAGTILGAKALGVAKGGHIRRGALSRAA